MPYYGWVDNERSRATDATFQADWIQRTAGVTPGVQAFGKEWFEHKVGLRMTMLGSHGTRVYAGDGPFINGQPCHRIAGNTGVAFGSVRRFSGLPARREPWNNGKR